MKNYQLIEKGLDLAEVGNVSWNRVVNEQFHFGQTFTRPGLEAIVSEAISAFESKHGRNILPWNLAKEGPYRGLSRYHNHRCADFPQNPVETCARFAGWLRVAQDDAVLTYYLKKTQTDRGMGSPYLYGDLWALIARHPSPGAFRRWILDVRRRSDQILKPYGFKTSWYGLGLTAAYGPRKIGKAAFRAAALTLDMSFSLSRGWGVPWHACKEKPVAMLQRYVGLREFVEQPRSIRALALMKWESGEYANIRELMSSMDIAVDETDGVRMYIDKNAPVEKVHGVTITVGAQGEKGYAERIYYLYRMGTHTYHAGYKEDVKEVLKIWQKQKRLAKENKRLFSKLLPKDYTILIWKQDSLNAGNCRPGTENFMRQQGVTRNYVPAEWLITHAQNPAVYRVLNHVAQSM